eukprot:TRINITY_DN2252_c0_g1_i2.p1 TRINITY_DN2252_c0_g1~~TRINITY_DN2252_c0_g1_i2.p1  ORF type:complete len:282 (-),score=65.48 TRINITY_DN2252_c0_g1_i2:240-1085(-)
MAGLADAWQVCKDFFASLRLLPPNSHDRPSQAALATHHLMTPAERSMNGIAGDSEEPQGELIHLDQRWSNSGNAYVFGSRYPPLFPPLVPPPVHQLTQDEKIIREVVHETMLRYDINTDFLVPRSSLTTQQAAQGTTPTADAFTRSAESIQHASQTPHIVLDLQAIRKAYVEAQQRAVTNGVVPGEAEQLEPIVAAHVFAMAVRDHLQRTVNWRLRQSRLAGVLPPLKIPRDGSNERRQRVLQSCALDEQLCSRVAPSIPGKHRPPKQQQQQQQPVVQLNE